MFVLSETVRALLADWWRPAAVAACFVALGTGTSLGEYTVERVVGSLNQPMYVTQAPGDNSSIYIVERNDGGNQLGRIRRYNLQSQALTTFLDVTGSIVSDGGLLSMTFHPDYQMNGLFYIVTNNNRINGLDEYRVVGGVPQLQRRLLQYTNLDNVFHTMNQPLFRPNGNNNELFVTTGDGGTQADDPDFNKSLIESPTSPYGKVMKIDLTQPFTTPASAPGPGTGVSVVALGIRNPYRASFDRQTGDFYFGDVGFNIAESIDFIPASHFANPSAPVLDFGWTDREGTVATVPGGGPGSPGDINPIFDYAHSGQPLPHQSVINGASVTAGYVYRGAAPEFQGRYFFSDFINGNVYSGTFNRNTNPATFNGTNLTGVQSHTSDFESRIGGGANIQYVTSFGEDNSGNLYIVKFGNAFFPPLGQGEIFRISPVSANTVALEINRDTGAITLRNPTAADITFSSLTISSAFGAIDPDELTPITGNYDATGNGAIDPNNTWTVTSSAGNHLQFSEMTTGDPGAIGPGEAIVLSPEGGWLQSTREDILASLMLAGGTVLNASVSYSGNGGNAFARSDLDFDGAIDVADWSVFVANNYVSLAGLSPAQSYALGDLDGDGDNDVADFRLFKSDFNSANGAGAFEAQVLGVPEPGSLQLVAALTVAWLAAFRRRRRRYLAMLFAVTFAAADGSREATAAIAHRYSFTSNANDSVGTAHGTVVDMGAPTAVFANGQLDLSANAGQASNAITEDAYVDLPNGVISTAFQSGTLRAATFETWVTVATHRNWAEIYAFGTSNCGEGMSCSGSDTDYITLIPANGAGSGTLWTVGHPAFGGDAPADANVMLPTGVQQHIVSVFDHNNTAAGPNGTITQYLNGRVAGTTAIHPNLQLNTMVDNNNWLGRSQWPDPLFDGSFNEFRIYDHALSPTEVATSTFFGPDTLNPGELLSVSVNRNTGAISMTNNAAIPVNVDFYRLASPGMALSLAGWNSLDDQNYDAVDGGDAGSVAGDSDGEGWDEAGGSNASQLVEFFLGESGSTIAPSETLNLGNAFNTSVFGPGNDGDLTFTFGLVGGLQITGNVNYVSGPAGVLGDYNNNGSVDAADYVLWRNGSPLQNEGVTPNSTTPEDYNFWRARFGANSGSAAASSAAVPEPVALPLATVLALFTVIVRRRSCTNFVRVRFDASNAPRFTHVGIALWEDK